MKTLIPVDPYIVRIARESKWGGEKKIAYYCASDDKSAEITVENRFCGNIGELATYLYLKSKRFHVAQPNLTTDKFSSWDDDVKSFRKMRIVRSGKSIDLDDDIIVKSQLDSKAIQYGLSWTFQLTTSDRSGDPAAYHPLNKLFTGVRLFSPKSLDVDEGWSAELHFYYYPDVFPYLGDPRLYKYLGVKKMIYENEVRSFEMGIQSLEEL